MAVDALAVFCLRGRDEASHEYNGHSVQRPIRFDLRGHLSTIKPGHDKIHEDKIRPEATRRLQCAGCVIFFTDDVMAGLLQNQMRALTKKRIIVYDQNAGLIRVEYCRCEWCHHRCVFLMRSGARGIAVESRLSRS